MRTCTHLVEQPFGEESLEESWKRRCVHRSPPGRRPSKPFRGKLQKFRNRPGCTSRYGQDRRDQHKSRASAVLVRHRTPARYQLMSRRVTKLWRKSWSRGPRPLRVFLAGLRRPIAQESAANVLRVEQGARRWPRSETRKASVARRRSSLSRCFAYRARARRVESSTGTKRDFPELGLSDGQNTSLQIHVRLVESQCFLRSQAGGGEEANEGFVT